MKAASPTSNKFPQFRLDIETHDKKLGFEMAGVGTSLVAGTTVDIPGGAKIKFLGLLGYKSVGIPEVLQFIVEATTTIELSLLASWLYDKVKTKKVDRIIVNRRVITEITEDSIYLALEEEFKIEK
jgi:hypothetical protein